MPGCHEWVAYFSQGPFDSKVQIGLMEVHDDGQLAYIDSEEFGPLDTATDALRWLVRHLSPRLGFPLH